MGGIFVLSAHFSLCLLRLHRTSLIGLLELLFRSCSHCRFVGHDIDTASSPCTGGPVTVTVDSGEPTLDLDGPRAFFWLSAVAEKADQSPGSAADEIGSRIVLEVVFVVHGCADTRLITL